MSEFLCQNMLCFVIKNIERVIWNFLYCETLDEEFFLVIISAVCRYVAIIDIDKR